MTRAWCYWRCLLSVDRVAADSPARFPTRFLSPLFSSRCFSADAKGFFYDLIESLPVSSPKTLTSACRSSSGKRQDALNPQRARWERRSDSQYRARCAPHYASVMVALLSISELREHVQEFDQSLSQPSQRLRNIKRALRPQPGFQTSASCRLLLNLRVD